LPGEFALGVAVTLRIAGTVLFVSAKTIEIHLGNVYRKLGVRSRTELARYFMQR
jgi:DNA-binding NarL/FixJ family response regulator